MLERRLTCLRAKYDIYVHVYTFVTAEGLVIFSDEQIGQQF